MIEVFKTNVADGDNASKLIAAIHKKFAAYTANFDLEDRDNILRIDCSSGEIQNSSVICLLKEFGFTAQVLPDEECRQQ